MAATGAAKARTTTAEGVLLKSSGKGYVITYHGKDIGMFTPLNTEKFPDCVNEIRNALRAWNGNKKVKKT